jgi:SH3-like domain-containing protein
MAIARTKRRTCVIFPFKRERAAMQHVKCALFAAIFAVSASASPTNAVQPDVAAGPASGLPLPRFVSLKADRVNVHIGPSKTHEVKWLYQRAGLPVEVTAEFENWRKIRDTDGTEGWVYHSLLSGRRTGMVISKDKDALISIHDSPDKEAPIAAQLEPGVQGAVKRCKNGWCQIAGRGFEGWIPQVRLWGVYPNETVE